jgi:hypothetical protein
MESDPRAVRTRPFVSSATVTGGQGIRRRWRRTTGDPGCRRQSAIVEAVDHLSSEVIERCASRGLSASETQAVEKHLAACPECEDRLQDEVELRTAMRSSSVAGVRRIVEARRKKAAKQ